VTKKKKNKEKDDESDDGEMKEIFQMAERNEVVSTDEAIARAKRKGFDVILVNEKTDPPLVKICSLDKFVFQEKKKEEKKAKNTKQLKMKEVKLSYTIGENDLSTRIRQVEGWLEKSQTQVRVTVIMKGRTRMFEPQARQLLKRVQAETASFGKALGAGDGDPIKRTPRGDLTLVLLSGADIKILKQLREVALEEFVDDGGDINDADEADEDDEDEDEDDDSDSDEEDPEVAEILEEIKEMRQDLLDCGIKPGRISGEPEMRELEARLKDARARVARAVHQHTAGILKQPMAASLVVLPAALAGLLQPRRHRRWLTRAVR